MRRFVCRQNRVPVAFKRRAALAPVPGVVDLLRNFEGWIGPAQRFARKRYFLFAERLSVGEISPGSVGRAFADDCLAADERGPVARVRLANRRVDGIHIVAVDMRDDPPSVRREARGSVVGEPASDFTVDRYSVVVVEADELGQTLRARE